MKKEFTVVLVLFLFFGGAASVYAVNGTRDRSCQQELCFRDENADGVCDNRTDCSFEVTCPMRDRNCPQADCRNDGFQDEDNDGICDHYAEGCGKHPSEIGCWGENTPGREKENCHRKGK